MNLPRNEWVVLAEYEPYTDTYELRIFYNEYDNKVVLTEEWDLKDVPEGAIMPPTVRISSAVWTGMDLPNLFRNVFVRETNWKKL